MSVYAIEHKGHALKERVLNYGKNGAPPDQAWVEIDLPDDLGRVLFRLRRGLSGYDALAADGRPINGFNHRYEALRRIRDLAVQEIERRKAAK